ncbi:cysteine hydrolase family protein [Streptomyces sp. NPDC056704]|uniref:cysteine hydrolase family protein n=1 Tax=Streptomyces sp. NPDC056704 TaxID=3345917 RepID=UPI0036855C31
MNVATGTPEASDAMGGRWACLAIDLQMDLCRDPRRRGAVDAMIPHLQTLIGLFAERGLPIYYTKFELEPDDPQFRRFGDTYCVRGTPGCDIVPELLPLRGEVVVKPKHSAFYGTDLEKRLRKAGVTGVVLAGLQTQICVLTTAADASYRGLDVVVATDAVVSSQDEVRLQAVEWIEKYVGRALRVDQIAAEL